MLEWVYNAYDLVRDTTRFKYLQLLHTRRLYELFLVYKRHFDEFICMIDSAIGDLETIIELKYSYQNAFKSFGSLEGDEYMDSMMTRIMDLMKSPGYMEINGPEPNTCIY